MTGDYKPDDSRMTDRPSQDNSHVTLPDFPTHNFRLIIMRESSGMTPLKTGRRTSNVC